jgi:hypothetical protein
MVAMTDEATADPADKTSPPAGRRLRHSLSSSEPSWPGRVLTLSAFVLAGVTLVSAAALLICIAAPGSAPASLLARVLPIPDVPAAAYVRDLDLASRAPAPRRGLLLKAAEGAAWAELRVAPMKPDAWLQLAYVRLLLRGGYGPEVATAYQNAYFVAPLDPSVARWRIRFGLEVWPELSPDLKRAVRTEIGAMWSLGPTAEAQMAELVQSVRNVEGHRAGVEILKALGWTPPVSTSTRAELGFIRPSI